MSANRAPTPAEQQSAEQAADHLLTWSVKDVERYFELFYSGAGRLKTA